MISIKVNEEFIDLPSDISINFNLLNPMFNDVGSHTLTYTVTNSDKNKRIYGFPGRLHKSELFTKDVEHEIFFKGILIFKGIQTVQYSERGLSAYSKISDGLFNALTKGKYLTELELGGERTLGTNYTEVVATLTESATGNYKTHDYALPTCWITNLADDSTVQTLYLGPSKGQMINKWKNGNFAVGNRDKYVDDGFTVAMPYMVYVLKQIFAEHGFIVKENFFETIDELTTLILYNTFCDGSFYLISSGPDIYEYRTKRTMHLADHVPYMTIKDFLNGLRDTFCAFTFCDFFKQTATIKSFNQIYGSDYVKDLSNIASVNPKIYYESFKNGYKFRFTPDSSDTYFSDFVASTDDFNIKEPVDTLASLPTTGNEHLDLRLVEDENKYYQWSYVDYPSIEGSGSWTLFTLNLLGEQSGNEDIVITSPFSTLLNYKGAVEWEKGNDMLIPRATQVGNFLRYNGKFKVPFSARLLFYRGLQPDSYPYDYPLASYDVYDYADNVIGEYSLKFNGSTGLKEKFFTKYLYWLENTVKIEYYLLLDLAFILTFNFWEKYRIREIDYLLDSLDFELTHAGISPVKTTMYKI